MQLEIITPESKVFSGEADAVQFPGLDGCFQVLNDHSAIISALSKGEVKVNLTSIFEKADDSIEFIKTDKSDNKVIRIDIKGGVMEMLNNKVIVLAE
jgi:F-type H+-transporting ATPase subunit epsilon